MNTPPNVMQHKGSEQGGREARRQEGEEDYENRVLLPCQYSLSVCYCLFLHFLVIWPAFILMCF